MNGTAEDFLFSVFFLLYSMRDHGHKKDMMAEEERPRQLFPAPWSYDLQQKGLQN